MSRRVPVFDHDDDVMGDAWSKWGLGVAAPCLLTIYAASCIMHQHATLIGRRGFRMPLTGSDAVAYGAAMLSAALFLNSRYFMSNSAKMMEYASLGVAASLVSGIVSLGFIIIRNMATL